MDFDLKALNVDVSNGALNGKKLPNSIKVLSWGKNTTTDGDVFLDERTLKVFDETQKKSGRDKDVALDFDHCTVPGAKEYVPGKPKAIAAYGQPVLKKGDGLYLEELEWTPEGEEYARNYKDLSPAAVTDRNGVVVGLHSVALTPNGAVYGLKFYSADFETMINKMSSNEALKKEYNQWPGNEGVKKLDSGDSGVTVAKVSGHGIDCMCSKCMDADMNMMDADDHEEKYGDVDYADKENKKYPIDTEKHIRAAWSYINMPKNAEEYDAGKLSTIKSHIKSAAEKQGIEISDEKTKTMSAGPLNDGETVIPVPRAYKGQPWYYNNMNNQIIQKMTATDVIRAMAVEMESEGKSDQAKAIFAFLAEYEGLKSAPGKLIVSAEDTENGKGGLKAYSAKFVELENKIKALELENKAQSQVHSESERSMLVATAVKEGKILPLSADEVKTIDLNILKSIVKNTPKVVPTNRIMKTLNADSKTTMTTADKKAKFLELIGPLV